MKKLIIALICALSYSANIYAQKLPVIPIEGMPPYKIGATAGFNASSFSASPYGYKAGFNVGIDFMLDASPLIKNTYLRTGLLLELKGASFDWDKVIRHRNPSVKFDYPIMNSATANVFYLEIPVNYGYAYSLTEDWILLGETGPYIAIGLGGRISNPSPNESSMPFYNHTVTYNNYEILSSPKRFDFGWDFAVGAMFLNKHQFKVGFQFGFLNVSNDFLQNRNLSIGYSYFFE
ncbi:MAG: outer membrane beta-barrel protein [Bacteroidales bacterium]|nr:outer membrane beta-barrel protein [Bacteroidales bacterium]